MFLYNPWKFHLLFYIILLKLPHTASSIPLFFFLELPIPVKIQTEGALEDLLFLKKLPRIFRFVTLPLKISDKMG